MSKNTTGDSASIGRHIINFTGKVKFILYASSVSITALGVDKQILSHSSSLVSALLLVSCWIWGCSALFSVIRIFWVDMCLVSDCCLL